MVGHLTYQYISKNDAFEDFLHITKDEFNLCSDLLADLSVADATTDGYGVKDHLVWLFSFSSVYANFSAMARILKIHKEVVRRKVLAVARSLAVILKVKYIGFKPYEQMVRESQASDFGRNPELAWLHNVPVFIIDGTGVEVYKPVDSRINRLQYCWFKKEHQLRVQVVIDITGHTVYVGPTKQGHMSDNTAMAEDLDTPGRLGLVGEFTAHFAQKLGDEPYVIDDIRNSLFVMLGDKGYGRFTPPPRTALVLTSSADGADDAGCRYIDKKKHGKCIFTSPIIAAYRSLIERVFGRLWNASVFLRGPVFSSQLGLVRNLMVIHLALFNRALSTGYAILGRTSTGQREAPGDIENE